MGERVELNVLAVGQGSCNLVAIYNADDKLVQLDLIDCGRRGGKIDSATLNAQMELIREQMQARAETADVAVKYYLDHLIISHADADHINLLTSSYLLKGLIPKKIEKEFASFTFSNADYEILLGKYVLLERKNEVMQIQTYTYKIDLSSAWNDFAQTVDAEFTLRWSCYPNMEQAILWVGSEIYYDFFDQEQYISMYMVFRWNLRDELVLKEITCEIEYEDYVDTFETYYLTKFLSKLTRTSKNGDPYGNINCMQDNLDEMLQWMMSYLDLNKQEIILSFIRKTTAEVDSLQGIHTVLDLECAMSILGDDEKEEGNCIIEEIIMGGLSSGSTENKKTVNAILNKLGCYNDYGVIYMEKSGNLQQEETIYLQKLPRCGTYGENLELHDEIRDENAGSITYSAKVFDQWIVLPGDATGDTMWYFLHSLWSDETVPKGAWMAAPHHGSNVTTISKVFMPDHTLLEEYLGNIEPSEIIVSAGYENSFGHPHCEFLNIAQSIMPEMQNLQPSFPCSEGARTLWGNWSGTQNIHSCLSISDGKCGYQNRTVVFTQKNQPLSSGGKYVQSFSILPQPHIPLQVPEQKRRGLTPVGKNGEFDFLIGEGIE